MRLSGQRDFAVRLVRELAREPGNFCVSPYSVWANLAALTAGAGGSTRRKLRRLLSLRRQERQHLEQRVYDELDSKVRLNLVNSLWRQHNLEFNEDIEAQLRKLGLHLSEVDFVAEPESARAAINEWVSEKTRGRIAEILGPSDVSAATLFVPVNTCYLLAGWAKPFVPEATSPGDFCCQDGAIVTVPMMSDLGSNCSALVEDDVKAIELPYIDPRFSMLIVVPEDLRDFEAKLDDAQIRKIWKAVYPGGMVMITLPRFSLERRVSLRPHLEQLGFSQLFSEHADFRGVSDEPGSHFDDVLHASFVDVDEIGTEAGSATASPMVLGIRSIEVNRPFWFFIQDAETGCILFAGRVEDPS